MSSNMQVHQHRNKHYLWFSFYWGVVTATNVHIHQNDLHIFVLNQHWHINDVHLQTNSSTPAETDSCFH